MQLLVTLGVFEYTLPWRHAWSSKLSFIGVVLLLSIAVRRGIVGRAGALPVPDRHLGEESLLLRNSTEIWERAM